MATPKVLVLTGYGINCDEETAFAFDRAGGQSEIIHVNDVILGHKKFRDYQILAFPGGFSYGDDTGSGNALANKIRNNLWDDLMDFVISDRLAIGICNGFQVMVNLGLLPGLGQEYGNRKVALVHNDLARYSNRWVDLKFEGSSPWVHRIDQLVAPIAHGEGRFYADREVLGELRRFHLVSARYVRGKVCDYQDLEANPNGSLEDIASITDESGKLIGMMPHPERAIDLTQLPYWTLLREESRRFGGSISWDSGLAIFKNGVEYFK